MTANGRPTAFGDVGAGEPSGWKWGRGAELDSSHPEPLCGVLMLYADSEKKLLDLKQHELTALRSCGLPLEVLDTQALFKVGSGGRPEPREHFGFADGIAQPHLRNDNAESERPGILQPSNEDNTVAAGEILLGYQNQYGQTPYSPVMERARDTPPSEGALWDPYAPELLVARQRPPVPRHNVFGKLITLFGQSGDEPTDSERFDLGRNGSYMVMRQLHQDVGEFRKAIEGACLGDAALVEYTASKVVGRFPNGTPLVKSPCGPNQKEYDDDNNLSYASDEHGIACPHGSHVRRTNPRDWDFFGPDKETGVLSRLLNYVLNAWLGGASNRRERALKVSKRHRIVRRGRAFGPPHQGMIGPAPPVPPGADSAERGLHFICFQANLRRGFEFLQHAWINNAGFAGLNNQPDLATGSGHKNGDLVIPGTSGAWRFSCEGARSGKGTAAGLSSFVTTQGGAYFFTPSQRAMAYLSRETGPTWAGTNEQIAPS